MKQHAEKQQKLKTFFEPSHVNMARAKNRLRGFENIHFFDEGLSDEPGQLFFSLHAGPVSSVPIVCRGIRFDEGFRADIIVENKVVLELK